MLPRSQRLSKKLFDDVMKKGKIFHSSLFVVRITAALGQTRIAAVAPQKIAKTAVERNRMRRKIYDAVAPAYPLIRSGFNLIIFAKSGALTLEIADLERDLRQIFVKAGLMK